MGRRRLPAAQAASSRTTGDPSVHAAHLSICTQIARILHACRNMTIFAFSAAPLAGSPWDIALGSWFNIQVTGRLRALSATVHLHDQGQRRPVHLVQPNRVPQVLGP